MPTTRTATPTPYARLKLTKKVPQVIRRDHPFHFILRVKNRGPARAAGVVITDVLPEGMWFREATGAQAQCGAAAQVITCTVAELEVGEAVTVHLWVRYLGQSVRLKNCATVRAATAWRGKFTRKARVRKARVRKARVRKARVRAAVNLFASMEQVRELELRQGTRRQLGCAGGQG